MFHHFRAVKFSPETATDKHNEKIADDACVLACNERKDRTSHLHISVFIQPKLMITSLRRIWSPSNPKWQRNLWYRNLWTQKEL